LGVSNNRALTTLGQVKEEESSHEVEKLHSLRRVSADTIPAGDANEDRFESPFKGAVTAVPSLVKHSTYRGRPLAATQAVKVPLGACERDGGRGPLGVSTNGSAKLFASGQVFRERGPGDHLTGCVECWARRCGPVEGDVRSCRKQHLIRGEFDNVSVLERQSRGCCG
jgi:hypothetical protein